jgi:hypothetical protein
MMVPWIMALMASQAVVGLVSLLRVAKHTAVSKGMMPVAEIRTMTAATIDLVSKLIGGVIHPQGLEHEVSCRR